jgi:hypothetical protein
MFQWASDTFDKLSEKVAPPPTDAAGRFGYAVTRLDENTAMGCIAEIDPIQTIVNQSRGWFPIHMACQYSMVRLIRLLMNQPGASIQQMDYANCTPLHHACMSTQRATGLEVVKILINECGADPCAKNSQGQTPYDVATLDSIRQYLLPIQLQRETQYALDNGGKGLPPGIDLGGMKINRANMAPPPTFGGAGVAAAAPPSADPSSRYPQTPGVVAAEAAATGPSRYPQTPGMPAPPFGSPMAAAGRAAPSQQQHHHQQPQQQYQQPQPQPTTPAAPAAQPIARAPATMPGRSATANGARSQSTGSMPGKYSRSHARSGGSSLAVYSKYKADGFHSSSSDKNLQAKYGHVGANAHTGPPPPSSGNGVASTAAAPMSGNSVGSFSSPPGPNPFSGAPVSRYASYGGQTTMTSPASGPVYSGMGYGMPTQPQTTPSFFTPGATTNNTAAAATPSSSAMTNGGPTSPFMPPPPYSGTKATPLPAAGVPASTSTSPAMTANLFESPPETTTEATNDSGVTTTTAAVESKDEATPSRSNNDWVEVADPTSGKSYYFNSKTNETSWENPNPPTAAPARAPVAAAPSSAESASSLFESPPNSSGVTTPATASITATGESKEPIDSETKQEEIPAAFSPITTSDDTSNGWVEVADPTSGKSYYFNSKTNETSWDNPNPPTAARAPVAPAPSSAESASNLFESPPNSSGVTTPATVSITATGESKEPTDSETKQEEIPAAFSPITTSDDTSNDWVEVADPTSGKTYYFNSKTNETSWHNPNASTAVAAAVEESTTATEQDSNDDSDWSESLDPSSGKSYYYNSKTGETSWEKPTSTTVDEATDTATATTTADNETSQDASAWVEATDPSSGNIYYYNSATGETSWERPSALDSEEKSSSPESTTATPTETANSDADTADDIVPEDAAPEAQVEKEETAETESYQDTLSPNGPIKEETDSSVVAEETLSIGIAEESSAIATATNSEDDNTPAGMKTAQDDSVIRTETTTETTIDGSSSNALPDGWIEATDSSSGKVYYCNTDTQETSWERPVVENTAGTSKERTELEVTETVVIEDIADGWEEVQDPTTGNTYYFNKETQETSWEKPTSTIPESATTTNDDTSSSQQENDWVETLDPNSGKNYYYNAKTGETSWEKPATFKMQEDSPPSMASETQPVDGNAAESKPTSTEGTFAQPSVNVDTKSEETNEVKPRSSPLSIRSTVSAEDMFSSPPGKNQSNGTPGPFTNFDRPDFISPAAATQGSVESPGGLDTPVTTAEGLFGANDTEPALINKLESNQMNAVASTAEDLFGANDAEPALVKTLEPLSLQNVEDSNEIDDGDMTDGDMTDIPLTPGPESLIKFSKDLPSIPNTTVAPPAPVVKEDLFAAIGMPPPPFQSKR